MTEPRRTFWWVIISTILFVVSLAGVPGDVQALLGWIQSALNLINQNGARWICFALAIVSFILVFYPPNIRKEIWNRFRLAGQRIVTAHLFNPIESSGWKQVGGVPPRVATLTIKDQVAVQLNSNDRNGFDIAFAIQSLDPSGRYVRVKADSVTDFRGRDPDFSMVSGFDFAFSFQVKRRSDSETIGVTVVAKTRGKTFRHINSHTWDFVVDAIRDHDSWETLVIDIADLQALEYSPKKYDFLGVSGFQLKVGSATIAGIDVLQPATWRQRWATVVRWETWIPWST